MRASTRDSEIPFDFGEVSQNEFLDTPDALSHDIVELGAFLESTSAWVKGYFFSNLPYSHLNFPESPDLKCLTELGSPCESLRDSILNCRESTVSMISPETRTFNYLKKTKEDFEATTFQKLQSIYRELEEFKNQVVEASKILKEGIARAQTFGFDKEATENNNLVENSIRAKEAIYFLTHKVKPSSHKRCFSEVKSRNQSQLVLPEQVVNKLDKTVLDNCLVAVYPMFCKIKSLKERKKYYSRLYRYTSKIFEEQEKHLKELLEVSTQQRPRSLKVCVLAVIGCLRIQKLKRSGLFKCQGVLLPILPYPEMVELRYPSKSVLSQIFYFFQKRHGKVHSQKQNFKSLISFQVKKFRRLFSEFNSVLGILIKKNSEQKKVISSALNEVQNLKENNQELKSTLKQTIEYAEALDKQLNPQLEDTACADTGECFLKEIESQEKALKSLHLQYNKLELKYQKLKKNYEEEGHTVSSDSFFLNTEEFSRELKSLFTE